MAEGTPKAIEPKGIVRNATKIGVQDGQAEDLINLRFMDGSWRASGNGRQIENMPTGTIYQQLYVHTNIYHHLLGVDNGTLYWFAEIDNDGVTFYPLDNTTDRSQWPEDKQDLPTERKALTTVVGDVWITQTGHLLTVIDEADDFEHFVFKTSTKEYIEVNMDVNGKATDRSLYPFGQVHFNLYKNPNYIAKKESENSVTPSSLHPIGTDPYTYQKSVLDTIASSELLHNTYITMLGEQTEKNRFTHPFLAIAAVKLYDGSIAYASNPVLLNPNELSNKAKELYCFDKVKDGWEASTPDDFFYRTTPTHLTGVNQDWKENSFLCIPDAKVYGPVAGGIANLTFEKLFVGGNTGAEIPTDYDARKNAGHHYCAVFKDAINEPTFCAGGYIYSSQDIPVKNKYRMLGYDLVMSLDSEILTFLRNNSDTIQSICIFVTPQVENLKLIKENDSSVERYGQLKVRHASTWNFYFGFLPNIRPDEEIMHDLIHHPFYLLREYNQNNISELLSNPVIDLSAPEYKGVLKNITQQKVLDTETTSRTTYLPKVSYMYNNRLHIANYKTHPFFGYPIDLFHLHNHSVKVQDGAWFKGVLPNLADNNDAYLQYPRTQHTFIPSDIDSSGYGPGAPVAASKIKSKGDVFAFIAVEIDTEQGLQKVVRYIKAYDTKPAVNGRADFIEDLNPLLTYPDARAKSMTVFLMTINGNSSTTTAGVVCWYEKFELKPHPYLNMAYHIDPDLKPIKLRSSTSWNQDANPNDGISHHFDNSIYRYLDGVAGVDYIVDSEIKEIHPFNAPEMQNTEEYFPNGLKVSKTDQPMFFPVENTYRVGSAEILALMSNTIAVGTGQTGDAPLYVFCKDGVYALFVDASGQMAYPNARILARDVCNNPRSVTPIDAGVVFTTDRGLMMIAGEQVQEIGAPAEGDVVQFWNAGSVDYSKIATASMQQIAGLPSELCSTTDFLTYLQDKGTSGKAAIINYNHNMRELMVSNPNYPYSYVLDREGNWSRRDYTAAQYVNNYPTSYRVDADGHFYKVDDEGDENTSLEHRKEADNKIFYLSNVIKLDSIGFKQAYRFVVRGYFETMEGANIACVVEGSYDGRKFRPLGFNRKAGKFRDIGCMVERTDVRFFRICLSGQVTGKTRIDYMEMSAGASMLNTKIR